MSLALLETLNDIGASEFLGIRTITVTVYTTWISRSDLAGAAQIAGIVLTFVFMILGLEFFCSGENRYSVVAVCGEYNKSGFMAGVDGCCAALQHCPLFWDFCAPVLFPGMGKCKASRRRDYDIFIIAVSTEKNTLFLASGTTLIVSGVSLLVVWSARHSVLNSRFIEFRRTVMHPASSGYAVPGTILAIGFLPPAMLVDHWLAGLLNISGLPLMSAGILLVICCAIRFPGHFNRSA
ncbi:hypothetical protein ABR759_09025 [Escherichia coli]